MISTMVGSYPKVAEGAYGTKLIGTLNRWQRKEINDSDLEKVCQELTRAVIKEQEEAGLDLLTDGQLRWEDLVTPFAKGLEGFEINGLTRWFDNNVYYRRPILKKSPKRRGNILVNAYRFAAGCTRRPVKAVLPGPYTFVKTSEDNHYRRERPYVLKMAELLNEEACALAKAGAPLIQFDEPALGFGKPNLKLAIEAIGIATRGVASKTAVRCYFGELNGIIGPLMRAKTDILGIDVVSDPKALSKLRNVKITKELSIGCMDGRNTKLESVAQLHKVFDSITKLVPQDRLSVSPSCGLEFLPHAQAKAKLKRLADALRAYKRKGGRG